MRRMQLVMVLSLLAAVGVGLALLLDGGGVDSGPGLTPRTRPAGARTPAGEVGAEGLAAATRTLEVQVEGCRGPAGGALVFARGAEGLVSGESDEQGRVRLAVGEGELEVSARVGGWESPKVRAGDDGLLILAACAGAAIHGRVLDETGAVQSGLRLQLLDGEAEPLDEVLTDANGVYELIDPSLDARFIEIDPPHWGGREIAPLAVGERREQDLIVGNHRDIKGWVLDLSGDPQPGVPVVLTAEQGGSRWMTITDAGGGFLFEYVPATPVRVTADGGDLGVSSARLARTSEDRREVTLVLEPTTTLVVYAGAKVRGQVIVRSWSAGAHGEDEIWVDDKRPLNEIYGEGPYPNEDTGVYEPYDQAAGEPTEDTPAVDPEVAMERMDEVLGEVLRSYDAEDPEGGLTRLALAMVEVEPGLVEELRRDAEKLDPGLVGASLEELARTAAKKVLTEEPEVVEILRLAADKVANGSSGLEAIMGASQELASQGNEAPPPSENLEDRAIEAEAAVDVEPMIEPGVEAVPEGELLGEGEGMYTGELGEPNAGLDGEPPPTDDLSVLRALLGTEQISPAGEERAVVARGGLGQELAVRGALLYDISIRLEIPGQPEGYELSCGQVLAVTGETVEILCGDRAETVVSGRVIDAEGRPIEGLTVALYAGAPETLAQTGKDGRFSVAVEVDVAVPCELGVIDTSGERRPSTRRGLACGPGRSVEAGDIVSRREDEAPVLLLSEPFGGVGAALSSGSEGIIIDSVGDDGPLALEGVEGGATIVRVDDEEATSWSMDDMLVKLRGDVGTEVFLRLRSREGELYETSIERGLITPEPAPIYDY